jgi:WD40 repeat protein
VQFFNLNSTTISEGRNITGHTSIVNGFAFINADKFATASDDFSIKVWDRNTGSLVNTYYGHTNKVRALVILPNGLLASGSSDGTILLWNMRFQTVKRVDIIQQVTYLMFNQKIGLNGALVVSAVNSLSYYDAATFDLINVVNTNRFYNGMEILSHGNVLVGGKYLDVYSTTGILLFSYNNTPNVIQTMELLPDNVTVALGFNNGSIGLFNSNMNTLGYKLQALAHYSTIYLLTVTPDLVYLLSGGSDVQLFLWTWNTMSLKFFKSLTTNVWCSGGILIPSTFTGMKKQT